MNPILKKQSILFGVIAGLIFAAFSMGTYYTSINSFASFSLLYTWIPSIFILILVGSFMARKKAGGYLEFKQALQYAIIAYLIYELIYAIVTYILYVAIDKNLTQKLLDVIMQKTTQWMKSFGSSDAQINDAIAKSKQGNVQTGIREILIGIGWAMLLNFVKALIIAFIIKKDKPADLDFNPTPYKS
jgi:Protein of unknown function (DUF4199)